MGANRGRRVEGRGTRRVRERRGGGWEGMNKGDCNDVCLLRGDARVFVDLAVKTVEDFVRTKKKLTEANASETASESESAAAAAAGNTASVVVVAREGTNVACARDLVTSLVASLSDATTVLDALTATREGELKRMQVTPNTTKIESSGDTKNTADNAIWLVSQVSHSLSPFLSLSLSLSFPSPLRLR